jgi:hypothetical protein
MPSGEQLLDAHAQLIAAVNAACSAALKAGLPVEIVASTLTEIVNLIQAES